MFGLLMLLGVGALGVYVATHSEDAASSPSSPTPPEFGSSDPGVVDTRRAPLPPPPPPLESPDQFPVKLDQFEPIGEAAGKAAGELAGSLADVFRNATQAGGCSGCGGGS